MKLNKRLVEAVKNMYSAYRSVYRSDYRSTPKSAYESSYWSAYRSAYESSYWSAYDSSKINKQKVLDIVKDKYNETK